MCIGMTVKYIPLLYQIHQGNDLGRYNDYDYFVTIHQLLAL